MNNNTKSHRRLLEHDLALPGMNVFPLKHQPRHSRKAKVGQPGKIHHKPNAALVPIISYNKA